MSFTQRIQEHRSTVILAVLVIFSLSSLASGTQATLLRRSARAVVNVIALPFLTVIQNVETGTDYVVTMVTDYSATQRENAFLRRTLADANLRTMSRNEVLLENKRLRRMMGFERNQPGLTLEPAEVIERFEGKLIVDRGSRHGMRESMVAVTPDGIVGMVVEVGLFTSNILTLNDPECRVGAMIRRNRVRGIVHGAGSGQTCTMQYIDLKDKVHVGDEVVTRPESVFPSGYPVGVVTAVHGVNTLQKTADIRPAVDPNSVDELFVLRRAQISHQELAEPYDPSPVSDRAVRLPFDRSRQERYAP